MQTMRNISLLLFSLGAAARGAPILRAFAYVASVLASALYFPETPVLLDKLVLEQVAAGPPNFLSFAQAGCVPHSDIQ
jgi:hypothetical protein